MKISEVEIKNNLKICQSSHTNGGPINGSN